MKRLLMLALAPLAWSTYAAAQDPNQGHQMGDMAGMTMPAKTAAPAAAPPQPAMSEIDQSAASSQAMPAPSPTTAADAESDAEPSAPPTPTDHLAEGYFDQAAMAQARRMLASEHGGAAVSMVMANLLEYQAHGGGGGYRWDGEAWIGGDLNRLVVKSEGEGRRQGLDSGEVQALYSRAVGPYFDLQTGVRQDFSPRGRTYATVATQGLLPYLFDVNGALFVSTKGEVLGRLEGMYDLRLTQRWILQPRAELNFAAQDSRNIRTGAGLSNAELGLRLRYEIRRELAPYIGVSWDRKVGRTAQFARAAGDGVEDTSVVIGVRGFF